MPVGGYYIEMQGADELKRALLATERGMKDLSKVHRDIGKMAGQYVRAHEPLPSYDQRKDGKGHLPAGWLQAHTKGGGGKAGAYVEASTQPANYLMIQEFGGTSFWHKSGRGALRAANRAHRTNVEAASRAGIRGHTIYKKARNPRGYFLWNVVWRLRDPIGRMYTNELEAVAAKNDLPLEFTTSNLGLEPMPPPGR